MAKLHYISFVRFPTEKAHGLQIAQNCEAFAEQGYDVHLWTATRWNTPAMQKIQNPLAYYGVDENFSVHKIPCIDVMPLAFKNRFLERIAFYIQMLTYLFMMFFRFLFDDADIYYSRDEWILLVLGWIKPKQKLAYESHSISPSKRGQNLQRRVLQNVGSVIAITQPLREKLITLGANDERVIVAHDGIRQARFENLPTLQEARETLNWRQDLFIVGYVGRLQTIGMDKGVGALIEAIAQLDEEVAIGLVGGPDDIAETYRKQWKTLQQNDALFLYAGHVQPKDVPIYIRALDVCTMPFPETTHFANYASPLKLFEYMASERAVIASDLPAWADVVQQNENSLLVKPANVADIAQAIQQLKGDSALRERLGKKARQQILETYTWSARAENILRHIHEIKQ